MMAHVDSTNGSPNQRQGRNCAAYVLSWPAAGVLCLVLLCVAGCGTTRWTNSPRTATEMLLISDAIDRSIDQFDFRALAGQSVYFDHQYLSGTVDKDYIVSSLRQKLLASGCTLKDDRYDAQFVVEARSGAVGTDQHDVTVGVPSVNIPPILGGVAGIPSSIPEIPLVKKTAQKGVAKLAVFAYERETGQAVWQSGAAPVNSTAQHTWIFGAGPIQRGTIYKGTKFAGDRLPVPSLPGEGGSEDMNAHLSVTSRADFDLPRSSNSEVQLAGHEEPSGDGPTSPPVEAPDSNENAPPSERP